jgi:hypothetical protein
MAALRNFVKQDALKLRKEASYADKKRGVDASEIIRRRKMGSGDRKGKALS